jgi:hypothetical protein
MRRARAIRRRLWWSLKVKVMRISRGIWREWSGGLSSGGRIGRRVGSRIYMDTRKVERDTI